MKFCRSLPFQDLIRKVFRFLFYKLSFLGKGIVTIKSNLYFRRWDVKIGKNVRLDIKSFNVEIEEGFELYNNCVVEVGDEARLKIGKGCLFSYGVVLQCMQSVEIGNYVQLGEYTSLRDTSHSFSDVSNPMKFQEDVSKRIVIGDDVWIGRGCIILPGTEIGRGVIIGANSVVKGELQDYGVYVGTPVRLIKSRK